MAPPLGKKLFVIHYDGCWGRIRHGSITRADYKGGKLKCLTLDGDILQYMDLRKEVLSLLGEELSSEAEVYMACLISGSFYSITHDDHLMHMWAHLKPAPDKRFHMYVGSKSQNPCKTSSSKTNESYGNELGENIMLGDGLSQDKHLMTTTVATVINDWADVIISGQAFDDAPEMDNDSVTKMVEMPDCEFGEDGNGLSDSSDEDEADRHGFVHKEDYGPIVDLNAGYFSSHSSLEDDAEYVPNESEDEFDSENEGHYAYDDEELTVVKARNEWEMEIEKEGEEEFNSLMRLTENVFEKEENERINDPDPTVRVGELVEGMEWESMNEARACFKKYAIERNFSYKQVKNVKKRIRLVCKDVTCGWKLLASTKADKITVKLRSISGVHTCQADGKNKNSHAFSLGYARIGRFC
ncbi:hypothetical protein FRX31_019381 [Thalictrum thalictroides]|uniref:Transposase MuDR plant domain-containing protein n=1 Tax=Thalictrum thalictroides TaxID=46969 RepID=A0A7J6W1Q4_THATH|nr:hypothetical protein FRX31_019381 [Thalictrum thalictroides]